MNPQAKTAALESADTQQSVSALLDQGLTPDDIIVIARKVQHEKSVADTQAKLGFLLTAEQSSAVCDFLLTPPELAAFPPNLPAYLTDLGVVLQARDPAAVSTHMLLTLRAMILQRPDLVFPKETSEDKNLKTPTEPTDKA